MLNTPKIRIEKYEKGFVVEIQKRKWYGKKYWIHIISVSGIPSEPWYFQYFDIALNEALRYLKNSIIVESR